MEKCPKSLLDKLIKRSFEDFEIHEAILDEIQVYQKKMGNLWRAEISRRISEVLFGRILKGIPGKKYESNFRRISKPSSSRRHHGQHHFDAVYNKRDFIKVLYKIYQRDY